MEAPLVLKRVREGSLVTLTLNGKLEDHGIVCNLKEQSDGSQAFHVFWGKTGRRWERSTVKWSTYDLNYSSVTVLDVQVF